ncbi:hypothetical protein E8E14_001133 [Neopestalotiopsis sp. 37M]|nr:hypothetical protein E8E14_001133 [Neopestalotiopsis sp. 37M]
MLNGNLPADVKSLHDRYGAIVRIAPNEISFIASPAWKDIYGRKEFIRPQEMRSRLPGKNADGMCSADAADHTRFRKIFNPAFSEASVSRYESTVQSYVDKLIKGLLNVSKSESQQTNVVDWFNFTTFDVISDLGWGTSLGCLDNNEYHPYLMVIGQFKANLFESAAKYYPLIHWILTLATPKSALEALELVTSTAEKYVRDRLEKGSGQDDVLNYAIKARELSPGAISVEELEANSSNLIIAGSEPTTTALVGTLNCLLQHPEKLAKLVDEIRTAFPKYTDITVHSTKSLPYLTAVLNEGMRMCPPVPDNLRRVVTEPGATIAGHLVPGGTVVSMPCWATFQSTANFSRPDKFWPERWLMKETPEGEDRAAFQPFSYGPGNCLGQNLAWMEMRLIFTKILWNFDIEVPEQCSPVDWASQKIWWSWDKRPLQVKFSNVR